MTTEPDKSQHPQLARWGPRRADGIVWVWRLAGSGPGGVAVSGHIWREKPMSQLMGRQRKFPLTHRRVLRFVLFTPQTHPP